MENCGSLCVTVLVAIVVAAVVQPGVASTPGGQKLATCCKTVSPQKIEEPILGYLIQERNLPCVKAVIFQTKSGLYCSQLTAPWVLPKIVAFRKAQAQEKLLSATPSTGVSLLSIITSTASPLPPSSSPFPSFPSSTEMPSGESMSEDKEE